MSSSAKMICINEAYREVEEEKGIRNSQISFKMMTFEHFLHVSPSMAHNHERELWKRM